MPTTWHFVRHGQSVANAEGWVAGHVDTPLTELGKHQARQLRPALEGLSVERVVASDLCRAHRTAELAWGHQTPPITSHPELRERDLGLWEREPLQTLRADGRIEALYGWASHPPHGESQRALARRVLRWLAGHDDGQDTLLFVHGGLIRCIIGLVDGTPTDEIGLWKVKNTQHVQRRLSRGRWRELLETLP